MPPYTPLAVANYLVSTHGARWPGNGIEHMKLQKLAYCAHGWWLAFEKEPLLSERPEVWRYGPVFSSLYHGLKPFGRSPITQPVSASPFQPIEMIAADDHATQALLNWIWGRYGHLSAFALSEMTHKPGTAWYQQAQKHNFLVPEHLEIPDDLIRSEFRGYAEEVPARA
jgi:uncharacterized phage-associated protein